MALRLDVALVQRGLVPSRERAQAAIAAALVLVAGQPAKKASLQVEDGTEVTLVADPVGGYVGRGALKLAGAFAAWPIDPSGLTCLDVGASTGGFTDLLLQRGAARVYAVDVGHGQLAPSLVADTRVVNLEGTDVRKLKSLPEAIDLAAVDVSFISLTLVLPAVVHLLRPGATLIALVKPQFEVGKAGVGKGGIVRDEALRQRAVSTVCAAATGAGCTIVGTTPSPITGGDGNQEHLLLCVKKNDMV